MNKTIYIRDEDVSAWERARELAGDKLSPVIMEGLRSFVREKESQAVQLKGFERIVLKFNDANNSNLATAKAFVGRWIISPEEHFGYEPPKPRVSPLALAISDNMLNQFSDLDQEPPAPSLRKYCFAVAETAKGRIVVFSWEEWSNNVRREERFEIFDNVEVAAQDSRLNWAMRKFVERRGVPVEELDI